MLPMQILHHLQAQPHRTRPVIPLILDAPRLHLLETHDERTIDGACPDQRARQLQPRRASRARVVRVVHRYRRHAQLVEDALPGCRTAEAVACHARLYIVVRDVGVQKRLHGGFVAQLRILARAAWLDELREAHA